MHMNMSVELSVAVLVFLGLIFVVYLFLLAVWMFCPGLASTVKMSRLVLLLGGISFDILARRTYWMPYSGRSFGFFGSIGYNLSFFICYSVRLVHLQFRTVRLGNIRGL